MAVTAARGKLGEFGGSGLLSLGYAAVSAGMSWTPSHVLTPIRMVGVGKLEELNGCAVFDDERDAHAVGWAVRRNQNFPAYQLGCKITHLKSNMWHLPHQLGNRRVRFEAHPFHAILAVFVPDNKDL